MATRRALGIGLVLCSRFAGAQVVLPTLFAPTSGRTDGAWARIQAVPAGPARLEVLSQLSIGVASRRNGDLVDYYGGQSLSSQWTLPVDSRTSAWVMLGVSPSGGHFEDNDNHGHGYFDDRTFRTRVVHRFSKQVAASFEVSSDLITADLDSNLVGTAIPLLGKDPGIRFHQGRQEQPFSVRYDPNSAFGLEATISKTQTTGAFDLIQTDGPHVLSLPVQSSGDLVELRMIHRWGLHSVDAMAARRSASQDQSLSLDGAKFGPGSYHEEAQMVTVGLNLPGKKQDKWRLDWSNCNIESDLSGYTIKPNLLGFSLPGGTRATVNGQLAVHQSQVGVSWTRGSEKNGFEWGYAQIWSPFQAKGSYLGQLFVFSVGDSGAVQYSQVSLGALRYTRWFPMGSAQVRFGIQQLIPYNFEQDGVNSSNSGSSSGGSSNPGGQSTHSIGGTSFSFGISIPL